MRANGPSLQASRFPLKATNLESWFFFNTTENSTPTKGVFPFKAVTWKATHCSKGPATLQGGGDDFSIEGILGEQDHFWHIFHLGSRSSSEGQIPVLERATGQQLS